MADFCKECAEEMHFPLDDLAGLITTEEVAQGFGAVVICESCGITLVDHEGKCLGNCDNPKHGAQTNGPK